MYGGAADNWTSSALPVVFERVIAEDAHYSARALRPSTWTSVELLAAGVDLSAHQLAGSLHVVFEEDKHINKSTRYRSIPSHTNTFRTIRQSVISLGSFLEVKEQFIRMHIN